MSSSRRRREEITTASWMATLGGAVLLVGIGFLGGVVAGVVTEDPGLVWAYLSGESVEASLPEVAAGAPLRPAVEEPEASVAQSRPLKGFAVQVGAFSELAQAEALQDKLRAKGHTAYIASAGGKHRVRVGPVEDRGKAEHLAETLGEQDLPTWILSE